MLWHSTFKLSECGACVTDDHMHDRASLDTRYWSHIVWTLIVTRYSRVDPIVIAKQEIRVYHQQVVYKSPTQDK